MTAFHRLPLVSRIAAAGAALLLGAPAWAGTVQPPASIAAAKKIVYCADIGAPPLSFFQEDGTLVGAEYEIGQAIAQQMGVAGQWRNVPFEGIIPALLAQQCDVIMSQLYDKSTRRQVIDFVDYLKASQALVVLKGNPGHLKSLADLSGLKVAVESGTTIQALVDDQNKTFAAAGQKPIGVIVFPKDTDAFEALRIGQVQAYGTTLETAAFHFLKAPDLFEIGGAPFSQAIVGAGFRKQDQDLQKAYAAALANIHKDGSYAAILKKWNISGDTLD
jgi:polar amino acid transport system substrate-binding protein